MSFLPDFDTDFRELHDLIYQAIQGRVLMAALELKVFDHLAEPKSAAQLAEDLELPEARCQAFLDALVSCGYAQKHGETHGNTVLSQRFLAGDGGAYLGDLLLDSWKMLVEPLDSLGRVLREGFPPTPEEGLGREELWAAMAHANAQYARAGLARLAVEELSALPGFQAMGKMLDLGGGPGLVAMAVAEANPALRAVVLDRPAVVEVARQYIERHGFGDRVRVLGADYVKDDIGHGYDLIWASSTLNFCRDSLGPMLDKVHRALNPGGVFACLQEGLTGEGTQPREMILGMFGAVLRGQMMAFRQGEIARAMLEAGFRQVCSRTVQTSCGPLDLDLAFI